ncbi:MAG: ATP-dependent helicase [Candidatus Bilamarchaeaceae archaeon]
MSSNKAKTVMNAQQSVGNLQIVARAGTGKTTTLVEALNAIYTGSPTIKPSPQQTDIISECCQLASKYEKPKTLFVAFNTSIAKELNSRLEQKNIPAQAATMHSTGLKLLRGSIRGYVRVDDRKAVKIFDELLDPQKKNGGFLLGNLVRAFDLARIELCQSKQDLEQVLPTIVAEHGLATEVIDHIDLIDTALKADSRIAKSGVIDFADMLYLPEVFNVTPDKYDLVFVDEAQDLSKAQQALVMRVGKSIITVGDDRQAIYGFAGADCNSMSRLREALNARVLPLTVTRRCPKAVVALARQIVPDIEALPDAPEGTVRTIDWEQLIPSVGNEDMILCRVNAPLVSLCFKLLRQGVRATIKGRNIGEGLISLIKKMKATTIPDLIRKVDEWYSKEEQAILNRKFPSESAIINLNDKYECLMAFITEANSVDDVIRKIEAIFSDANTAGVTLSSVHRAKGLEADRVFIVRPDLLPFPKAKEGWQFEQEMNLKYVAITRAKKELIWVSGGK